MSAEGKASEINLTFPQKVAMFKQKQSLPYEAKLPLVFARATEFHTKITKEFGANVHVSVGGLDSLTLLFYLRKYVDPNIKAISVSSLEHKSIQKIHEQVGIISLAPQKSKVNILNEFGFPVISKEKATKIETINNPTEKNATVRNAIMTGDCGKQGKFAKNSRMKLPLKWQRLFCGLENPEYKIAPFKASARCCYWMKELPCDEWAKENNSYPYLGLMASEGGRREKALMENGCNYYGKDRHSTRSCPFAILTRDDLLRLALELEVPIPEEYGEIISINEKLETTGAVRTGCDMCGFGIHLEPRPHRFDRLRVQNPKAWEFWMYKCVTDETGTYGWGRVLDYIGVKWESPPPQKFIQCCFFDYANIEKEVAIG